MIRPLKGIVLMLTICSSNSFADTNEDLSLMIKELEYLEKITMEMKVRNSDENGRVTFSYDLLALRIKGLRNGVEAHLQLVQSVPKWDRLGVDRTLKSN